MSEEWGTVWTLLKNARSHRIKKEKLYRIQFILDVPFYLLRESLEGKPEAKATQQLRVHVVVAEGGCCFLTPTTLGTFSRRSDAHFCTPHVHTDVYRRVW